MPNQRLAILLATAALGGCAVKDGLLADRARRDLLGLSEVDLQSCLGAPDQHASFGATDVLTYYATSSSSISYSVPVVGGLGFSNGGYCHMTVRLDAGRVTRVLYSGEKNATFAPDAYCAPIVRTCLGELAANHAPPSPPPHSGPAAPGGGMPAKGTAGRGGTVPPAASGPLPPPAP